MGNRKMIYIGIDNGITGSIGIIDEMGTGFLRTPIMIEQSYTKTKQNISRINHKELREALWIYKNKKSTIVMIERPMVNPTRFKASASALRALESTLIVIERLKLPYSYIDSKEWQKELLPKGIKGTPKLKKASLDIACRLFPQHKELLIKHEDGDGLLIAEYLRRTY